MFMQVAIGAIGVGIALMIGYLVVAQVQSAMPNESVVNISDDVDSAQDTIFAGFALLAVGIIVVVAFGMISLFK